MEDGTKHLKMELVVLDVLTTEDGYELYAILHAGYEGMPETPSWSRRSDHCDTGFFTDVDNLEEFVKEYEADGYFKVIKNYTN
jgi:hypothetical protein